MFFSKNLTISVRNTAAQLSEPLYVYEKDRNLIMYFKIMDHKYKFDKNPTNVLASMDDIMSAYVIIVDPNGYELTHQNGEVIDDEIKFVITDELIDEITEIGTYQLQFHIKCECSEFTIPPISFEVLERLKGIKSVTDESEVGDVITNDSESFIDEEGKLQIVWQKGDTISSVKLNQMVEVVNNAVDEEHLRKLNEQERVDKENERVTKENERIANEDTRTANENVRVTSESTRIANEDERKSKETLRQSEENKRQTNEQTRIQNEENRVTAENARVDKENERVTKENKRQTNEQTRIQNEENRVTAENARVSSMNDITTRFNDLIASLPQYPEVIDARDGEVSLKARLDRDIEKAKQVYVNVEGSYITTDSSSGYAKDVEILGNTIQDPNNLADIRSVGDKVEGQELYEIPVVSCGKNLLDNDKLVEGHWISKTTGDFASDTTWKATEEFIEILPNQEYTIITEIPSGTNPGYALYDTTKRYISGGKNGYFVTPSNAKYLRLTVNTGKTAMLCLGNVSMSEPYEPYIEDKLTILSPVQLEKVGDVADRIIEKDGVWGVEKNVETVVFDGSESVTHVETRTNTTTFNIPYNMQVKDSELVSNLFNWEHTYNDYEHIYSLFDSVFRVLISNDKANNVDDFKQYLSSNNLEVKYICKMPKFIPLPHDQQIKLRTFANKTNISFLTEIEGTIKAQVPKSLGATVNTHTEQISNLNNELDRVKKLEENTVSTVTTESDFTSVEATSNGYFEDVKLEGRTLIASNYIEKTTRYVRFKVKPNTDYTYVMTGLETTQFGVFNKLINSVIKNYERGHINVFNSGDNDELVVHKSDDYDTDNLGGSFLIEGDHTQNPPSYFEGLKSVGDGADEIEVLSSNANSFCTPSYYRVPAFSEVERNVPNSNIILIKNGSTTQNILFTDNSIERLDTTGNYFGQSHKIKVKNLKPNAEYQISYNIDFKQSNDVWCGFLDTGENVIPISSNHTRITRTRTSNHLGEIEGFMFVSDDWIKYSNIEIKLKESSVDDYTPHQSDKKRLLYYNEETQTWEKPILREWDSIEKHANGKYYYHQRSAEVVLNGSENWSISGHLNWSSAYCTDYINMQIADKGDTLICDRLTPHKSYDEMSGNDLIGITVTYDGYFGIKYLPNSDTKPTPSDVKQWLQANNVTVVYQLAEEKVYECTNIDLITYANETNYMVEAGAITPKTTLKVHNNISNVVSLLQKKVSVLESNITAMFRAVLAGDYQTLAYSLYPGDFNNRE